MASGAHHLILSPSYTAVAARVALGQLMSMMMSFTGVFTTLLVNRNQSYPLLQSTCVYAAILLVTLPVLFRKMQEYKKQEKEEGQTAEDLHRVGTTTTTSTHHSSGRSPSRSTKKKMSNPIPHALWKYALIALCDLEANFTVVFAYQYTNLTSVQLLDCFTVPCVMVLARLLVRPVPVYRRLQFLGVSLASLGVLALVVIDSYGGSRSGAGDQSGKRVVLGDCLCLVASFLYALSNVLCEKLLKQEHSQSSSSSTATVPSSESSTLVVVAAVGAPKTTVDCSRVEHSGSEALCVERGGKGRGDAESPSLPDVRGLHVGPPGRSRKEGAAESPPPEYKLHTPSGRASSPSLEDGGMLGSPSSQKAPNNQELGPFLAGDVLQEGGDGSPEVNAEDGPPPLSVVLSSTFCYLAMMSTFAFTFSVIQLIALDLHDITVGTSSSPYTTTAAGGGSSSSGGNGGKERQEGWMADDTASMFGFTLSMLMIYISMPLLFVYTSAAFANISLLTADIFALVWNVLIFAVDPKPLYFLPFTFTISGVIVYDLYGSNEESDPSKQTGDPSLCNEGGKGGGNQGGMVASSVAAEHPGATHQGLSSKGRGGPSLLEGHGGYTDLGTVEPTTAGYGATSSARVRFSQGTS